MNINERIQQETGLSRNDAINQDKFILKQTRQAEPIDRESHRIRVVINDNTIDRDHEILPPESFKKHLDWYLDNPVVLFAHDHLQPAVAKMVDYEITDSKFIAIDEFAVNQYEFAETLWNLYRDGFMRATSVGFIPIEWTRDEEEMEDILNNFGIDADVDDLSSIYTENELLEHSTVPIGSNRNALVKIYQQTKTHWDPVVVKMIEKLIEQPQVLPCGHAAVYDVDGTVIEPCPLCAEIGEAFKKSTSAEDTMKIWIRAVEKPYPNEHACRLQNPDDFQDDSFRRTQREHDGKEYSVIMGKLEGEDTMTEQAYRYSKDVWSESSAQTHCNDHDGSFEAAIEEGVSDLIDRGVVPFQDLPLADRDRDWNADAAVQRVRSRVGGPDKDDMDWAKYRTAFIWYNSDEIENFDSYKLPIADVIDDNLQAVPRGVFAVAVVLQGGRDGVDIPEEDINTAKNHIEEYYDKMDIEAPWNREEEDIAETLLAYKEDRSFTDELIDETRRAIDALKKRLVQIQQKSETDVDTDGDEQDTTEDDTEDDSKSLDKLNESLQNLLTEVKS